MRVCSGGKIPARAAQWWVGPSQVLSSPLGFLKKEGGDYLKQASDHKQIFGQEPKLFGERSSGQNLGQVQVTRIEIFLLSDHF